MIPRAPYIALRENGKLRQRIRRPICHKDGTVSFFFPYSDKWPTAGCWCSEYREIPPEALDLLPESERARVLEHLAPWEEMDAAAGMFQEIPDPARQYDPKKTIERLRRKAKRHNETRGKRGKKK